MSRVRLSARARMRLLEEAGFQCHICRLPIFPGQKWEVSHEIPLAIGGADTPENRRPAHYKCHRERTAKFDAPRIAKTKRQRQKNYGIGKARGPIMPGSRASGWKRKMDGTTERRG
jgi:5-methylcytosine-specific restriction protein A